LFEKVKLVQPFSSAFQRTPDIGSYPLQDNDWLLICQAVIGRRLTSILIYIWQSFGFSDGLCGFGNVLAKSVDYM